MANILEKSRANNRNVSLKTVAEAIEGALTPIPKNYKFPFPSNRCLYCEKVLKKRGFDEFLAITETGRMNAVNKVPCCGPCNSSKGAKCNQELFEWIEAGGRKNTIRVKRRDSIIEWWRENEQYMFIPGYIFEQKDAEIREAIHRFELEIRRIACSRPLKRLVDIPEHLRLDAIQAAQERLAAA